MRENKMKEDYCKICDYSELGFNNNRYCELWDRLIEEIDYCNNRMIDGIHDNMQD